MGDQGGALAEDTFLITPASEIMAIMGFAENYEMLKDMLSKITVGYTKEGKRLTAGDLKAQGAMAALLKNTIKPNLVQTSEGVPGKCGCSRSQIEDYAPLISRENLQ